MIFSFALGLFTAVNAVGQPLPSELTTVNCVHQKGCEPKDYQGTWTVTFIDPNLNVLEKCSVLTYNVTPDIDDKKLRFTEQCMRTRHEFTLIGAPTANGNSQIFKADKASANAISILQVYKIKNVVVAVSVRQPLFFAAVRNQKTLWLKHDVALSKTDTDRIGLEHSLWW